MQLSTQQAAIASRGRRLAAAIGAPVLLLVILIGFYWKLTLTDQYTWLESPDFANQVLPWLQYQAGEWHRHRVPLWDPYEWGGQSLIGQAQPGVAYPLNWILFQRRLSNGWIKQANLHWYFVIIHYTGALFCYWLCRDLGRSHAASLLAGTAFGITGWMGSTDWPQMLNGAVWAPAVFLFLLRVVRDERPLWNGGLAGAALGMAFLSGHHQVPIFITLAAAGVWIYVLFSRKSGRHMAVAAALLFGIFLFLVSALQTLPAYEYGKLSVRWVGSAEPVGWNTPVPYSVHQEYSLYPSTWIGTIFPGIARNANAYVTLPIVVLAFLALAGEWRDRTVRLFGAVAAGGFVFASGSFAVFHGIVYALVPMVEKARNDSMAVFIFHFGIIVLSAYGLDHFLDVPDAWVRRAMMITIGICTFPLAAMMALNMTQLAKNYDFDRISAACLYGLLMAGLLYGWRRGNISSRSAAALLVMIVMLAAALETGFNLPNRQQPSNYLKKMSENTDIVAFLRHQRGFVRVELDDHEIPYNFGDWHAIDVLGGYLASLTSNVDRVQGQYNARMLLGVNFWIGKKALRDNQAERMTGASGLKVYSNPEAFPKAWTVHQATAVKSKDVPDAITRHSLAELRQLTFVTGEAPALERCDGHDSVRVTGRDIDQAGIEADMSCRGMVIFADVWYPGWVATVDGKPVPIHEAYGVIRGVVVDAGQHRIEMRYRPKSVYWGAALTGTGWLGAAVLAWLAHRKRTAPS